MPSSRRTFLELGISLAGANAAAAELPKPIRLLVVTGGHGFDKSFFDLFPANPMWKWEHRAHREKSTSTVYADAIAHDFDVVLLYDMPQKISEPEQRNFLDLFRLGKGVVVLHHALCSYQHWDTYNEIIGVKMREGGDVTFPAFTFLHDVEFELKRLETNHPVLEGVSSFRVFDETYGRMFMDGGSEPLMMTNTATSIPMVVWARTYQLSRLVMIQPGHGPQIFHNPNFTRLLSNAVRWVAPRA